MGQQFDPEQIKLHHERQQVRHAAQPLRLSGNQRRVLQEFLRQHRRLIYALVVLIAAQTLLELVLPLLARTSAYRLAVLLDRPRAFTALGLLLGWLLLYAAVSFVSLRQEQQAVVLLVNDLRRRWFSTALAGAYRTSQERAGLIAKLTYHLSLLQLGLSASAAGLLRLLLLDAGLLALTAVLSTRLLAFALLAIPLQALLLWIGFAVAKRYVAQENTLSSRIIQHVAQSLAPLTSLRALQIERTQLVELDRLASLDLHYRVRRQLWVQFGPRLLFGLIVFSAAAAVLLQPYLTALLSATSFDQLAGQLTASVVTGLITFYLARSLYSSFRIGLYAFPAELGLTLAVPELTLPLTPAVPLPPFQQITFWTPKAKLTWMGDYWRKTTLTFHAGERVLITGPEGVGKTRLAELLAGQAGKLGRAWIVKIDSERLTYWQWQQRRAGIRYVNPAPPDELTFGVLLLGKDRREITAPDVEIVESALMGSLLFNFIRQQPKFLGSRFRQGQFSAVEGFLTQIAGCLIVQPLLVVIDNHWLDLNSEPVRQGLRLLAERLPASTTICFSTEPNSILRYDRTLAIAQNGLAAA